MPVKCSLTEYNRIVIGNADAPSLGIHLEGFPYPQSVCSRTRKPNLKTDTKEIWPVSASCHLGSG